MDIQRVQNTPNSNVVKHAPNKPRDTEFQGEKGDSLLCESSASMVGQSMLYVKPMSEEEKLQKLVSLMNEIPIYDNGKKTTLLNSIKQTREVSLSDLKDKAKSGHMDDMLSFLEILKNTAIDVDGSGVKKPISEFFQGGALPLCLIKWTEDFGPIKALFKELGDLGEFKGFKYQDLKHLILTYDSAECTPESYVDTYYYFKTAEDSNGESIYDFTPMDDESYPVTYLMKNVAGSKQEQTFEKLIQLIEGKALDGHFLYYTPFGSQLNDFVVDDIERLYSAYQNDIEPIDEFIPIVKDEADGIKTVSEGEAFQIDGEKFIRMKTADGKAEQIELTRDMYFKLFPPVERYGTTQNEIGNCWELTALNDMFSDTFSRVDLLKAFHQKGDDVYIKFPNGTADEIKFVNGELPEGINPNNYSRGARGIQLLEFADGYELQSSKIKDELDSFRDIVSRMQKGKGREISERILAESENFAKENMYNVTSIDPDFMHGEYSKYKKYSGDYDDAFAEARDGGYEHDVYKLFGYTKNFDINCFTKKGRKNAIKILKNPETFKTYKMGFGFRAPNVTKADEEKVDGRLGIYSGHSYRIKAGSINSDGEVETFKVINPWGVLESELSMEKLLELGDLLSLSRKP